MYVHIAMHGREILVPSGEALVRHCRCVSATANGNLLCLQQRTVQTVEVDRIGRAIRRITDNGDVAYIEIGIRNLHLRSTTDPYIVVLSLRIT